MSFHEIMLIFIKHVDDCLIFGTIKEHIETFLQSIKKTNKGDGTHLFGDKGLEFAEEGGFESFWESK